ncbi:hypothetical protein ACQ4PT_044016 [Festuca glaucescens]
MELLSTRRVQSFRHVQEEEVGPLVTAIAGVPPGETVNVSQGLAVLITDSTIHAMVGDRFRRRDEFLDNLRGGVKLFSGFNLVDLFPSSWLASFVTNSSRVACENHTKSFELIEYAMKQHQELKAAAASNGNVEEEKEDLLDVLLRIHKEGSHDVPYTMGAIKSLIVDLFSDGSKTSATTLQWPMSELIRNPDVMRKAQAEVQDKVNGKQTSPRTTWQT